MKHATDRIDLWYDDWRPAPDGWVWARTTREAMTLLASRRVRRASLDHDIFGDSQQGSDLVDWMEATGHWPEQIPMVHSANPAGKFYMERVIARHYLGEHVERAQAHLQHASDTAYYSQRLRDYRDVAMGVCD
jgi:hypothetical protein